MRKQFWHKNCVAIGLSSGFLEPLESTSISLIQTGINKLTAFLVNFEIQERQVAEANRLNRMEYERIRDFIILHYSLNGRSEPMWQQVRSAGIPATLQSKIAYFKAGGNVRLLEQESFVEASWISMYYGFGVNPVGLRPQMPAEKLHRIMDKMKSAIAKGCAIAPSHARFLASMTQ